MLTPAGPQTRQVALSPEVEFGGTVRRGATRLHLMMDRRTGRLMEVGPREHFIISRLDGSRSLADIEQEYAAHFGRRLGETGWRSILGLLGARGLLAGPGASGGRTPPPGPAAGPRPGWTRLLSGTVRLAGASPALDRLCHAPRFAFDRRLVPPALLLMAVMEVQVVRHAHSMLHQTWSLRSHPGLLLVVAVVQAVGLFVHELGHGVAARAFGATVTEFGLRYRLPTLSAYCKADDYLLLPSRGRRAATAGAGCYLSLLFLLPFFAVWEVAAPTGPVAGALAGLLLLGNAAAVVNLLPLPPLDGYKMLSHAVGMSGYAPESFRFVRRLAERAMGRRDAIAPYPKAARIAFAGYALGSAAVVGAAAAGLVLMSYHLLVHRLGAFAAVLPAVLFIAGTTVNLATTGGRRRHSEGSSREARG